MTMNDIKQITDGNGIEFTILLNGKRVKFILALLVKKNYMDDNWERYEYGFVNEDVTKYIRSTYTGGNTGFGADIPYGIKDINEQWKNEYKIISTVIDTINEYAKKIEQIRQDENEAYVQLQLKKVKAINELPKTFKIGLPALDKICKFVRSTAEYNPSRSRNICGGQTHIRFKTKTAMGNERTIYMYQYKSKDDKLLYKKFESNERYILNEVFKKYDPKFILQVLVGRENEIKQLIKETV